MLALQVQSCKKSFYGILKDKEEEYYVEYFQWNNLEVLAVSSYWNNLEGLAVSSHWTNHELFDHQVTAFVIVTNSDGAPPCLFSYYVKLYDFLLRLQTEAANRSIPHNLILSIFME